ncbi:MAG: hypothetical protein NVS4B11_10560 [Ktedonobacteraceae bacterium]
MCEYRFSNLVNYTHAQLSDMNNTSFHGYFFPWIMTSEESAEYWRVNQADANASVAMHDQNGAFVGLARMDTRGLRGRCGSFSIVPEFRGTGASILLAEQMVRVARKQGLKTLQLEVLAQNTRVLKVYEKVGFRITRELFTLEIATTSLPEAIPLQVKAVPTERLLPEQHNGEHPYWGLELASILSMRTEAFLALTPGGGVNSLIIRRNNGKIRILAALCQDTLSDAAWATFLRHAAGETTSIEVYNEPESSPLLTRYQRLGFTDIFSQYEMFLSL